MIEKNRKLKSKYGSGYKGTGKPSDLERDAGRKAKPFGYRFVGKHDYRVPTEMQIKRGLKRGTIDYEARPNRADVNPDKKVKLADGGMVFKKGDKVLLKDGGGQRIATVVQDGYDSKNRVRIRPEGFPMDMSVPMEAKYSDDKRLYVLHKMADGGMSQGYDDREDERLGMKHGKVSKKDFVGSHEKREHSRRDDAGFETRMKKGGKVGTSKEDRARYAKPAGWRWKEEAVTKRVIERKQLSMQPSKKMRDKYPDLVYYEDRLNKADKKPTRTSADSI